MSKITPFPKVAQCAERKRQLQAEYVVRIRHQGGEAIKKLTDWRRNIPTNDRERLAKNMNAIIDDYQIVPSKLDWKPDYMTVEEFRRDVHRMRLPELSAPGRRLIATPSKWVQLLGYVSKFVQERGESVSLEYLADRLIRGTRFHPTKKKQTKPEKILYMLGLWANELGEKQGLLSTYKMIAKARAEYYRVHRHHINARSTQPEHEPKDLCSKLSDDFNAASDKLSELFDKQFQCYSMEDWEDLYRVVPKDRHQHYKYIQDEITDWRNNYSTDGTLYSCSVDSPILVWEDGIRHLPRWFIGYVDDDNENILNSTDEYRLAEIIRQQGTVDPISLGMDVDWEVGVAYLVLYPDAGLNRIIPYLCRFTAEWSEFTPVDQSYDLENRKYFQPRGLNETTVSHTLLRRIEESMDEVYQDWEETSKHLKTYPYLAWEKSQDKAIDEEIEAVLLRTGRTKSNAVKEKP